MLLCFECFSIRAKNILNNQFYTCIYPDYLIASCVQKWHKIFLFDQMLMLSGHKHRTEHKIPCVIR